MVDIISTNLEHNQIQKLQIMEAARIVKRNYTAAPAKTTVLEQGPERAILEGACVAFASMDVLSGIEIIYPDLVIQVVANAVNAINIMSAQFSKYKLMHHQEMGWISKCFKVQICWKFER